MTLEDHIREIISSANLKERMAQYKEPHHGSSTGEIIEVKEYFDVHNFEYTPNKPRAVLGYIIESIRPIVNKILKENERDRY